MRHLCPHCRRVGVHTVQQQSGYLLTVLCRFCGGVFQRTAARIPLPQRMDPGARKERELRQWASALYGAANA